MPEDRADRLTRLAGLGFTIVYAALIGWLFVRQPQTVALYAEGVAAVDRAIALAPGGRLVVEDNSLQMQTGEELRAELAAGQRRDASDFNPMRVFRERK